MFSSKKIFLSSPSDKPKIIVVTPPQNSIVTETIPRTRIRLSVQGGSEAGHPCSYEWYALKGGAIERITDAGGDFTETSQTGDGMSYRVKITDTAGNSMSSPAAMMHYRSGWDGSISELMRGGVWTCGGTSELGTGTSWFKKQLGIAGSLGRYVHISSGARHAVAIRSDGRLFSWGASLHLAGRGAWGGQGQASNPELLGSDTWKTASAGGDHSAAIKSDGTLWGWGASQIMKGGAASNSPQLIDSGSWKHVSAGGGISGGHDLAIKQDGTLWAWGKGDKGQLGLGSVQSAELPTKVGNELWKWVAAGHDHSLGIRNDGTLWAWGENSPSGKLGTGDASNRTSPTLIDNGNWLAVACGLGVSLAIKSDGTLWAWGIRIGDKTRSSMRPKMISSDKWVDIAAGSFSSVAMKNDGSLWTWGENWAGQLSNAHMSNYTMPVGDGSNPFYGEVLEMTCVAVRSGMIHWVREGVDTVQPQNIEGGGDVLWQEPVNITMDNRSVSANSNHTYAIF